MHPKLRSTGSNALCCRRALAAIGLLAFVGVVADTAAAFPVAPATIWTVAGSDRPAGISGDGGGATEAQLNAPFDVAVDAAGNVLIADTENSRIRRVSPSGTITTVAGTSAGFSGDGGPAIAAQLNLPAAVAVDATGRIVIADSANNRVRRVDGNGTITTIAGTGVGGFSGDGGPGTAAQLNGPSGVAVDAAGDVLIADQSNHRVRRLSPAGTIDTIAGTGLGGLLFNPSGVAVDGARDVLIADTGHHRVVRIAANGTKDPNFIGTGQQGFAGDGGLAAAAELSFPTDIAVDPAGDVLVADSGNNRVRIVTPARFIETAAGSGVLGGPLGDGGAATAAGLAVPTGVAVGAGGHILVADRDDNRIRWVTGPQPGPDGPPGSIGATGPSGAAGGQGAPARLVAVAYQTRVTAGTVLVRYLLSADASVTVRVARRGTAARTVATLTGQAGRNVARWNRRFGRARAGSGSYTITLVAAAGGQTATTSVTVRMGRVRRQRQVK